jgi:hypothetical protein
MQAVIDLLDQDVRQDRQGMAFLYDASHGLQRL